MKRTKLIMAAALVILGIVGSAFAFKSKRGINLTRFTCDNAIPARCTVQVTLEDVDDIDHGEGLTYVDGDFQNKNCQTDGTCTHIYWYAQ